MSGGRRLKIECRKVEGLEIKSLKTWPELVDLPAKQVVVQTHSESQELLDGQAWFFPSVQGQWPKVQLLHGILKTIQLWFFPGDHEIWMEQTWEGIGISYLPH